jgi:hypothetical protein
VNDRSAAAFMTEFYGGLGEGLTAAAALRRTKLKFLHDREAWAHPYHWATFIVIGNGRWSGAPIPAPAGGWPILTVTGVVAAGAALAIWGWRRRSVSSKRL